MILYAAVPRAGDTICQNTRLKVIASCTVDYATAVCTVARHSLSTVQTRSTIKKLHSGIWPRVGLLRDGRPAGVPSAQGQVIASVIAQTRLIILWLLCGPRSRRPH